MKKTVDEVIRNRHSTRSFTDYIIPDQELMEILSAGIMAPSGKTRKPWRFVIVRNRETIKNIARKVTYSRFIRKAPQMILVYAKNDEAYPFEKDLIGIGACIENILLSATEKNYGSCVIGELLDKHDDISQYISVNTAGLKLICGIAIGRSVGTAVDREPLNVSDYVLGGVE